MSVLKFKPKKIVIPTVEEPKYKIYERAISRYAANHSLTESHSTDDIKKLIYLEVKYIEAINRSSKDDAGISFYKHSPRERFDILDAVVNMIGLLKPMELVEIFPIDKYYDGEAIQIKDYYFTMEALNKLDPGKPIGREAFALLWDYQNWALTFFTLELMSTMNLVGMYQGEPDMTDFIFNTLFDDTEKEETKKLPKYLKILK